MTAVLAPQRHRPLPTPTPGRGTDARAAHPAGRSLDRPVDRPVLRLVPTGDDVPRVIDWSRGLTGLGLVALVVAVMAGSVLLGRGAFASAAPSAPATVAAPSAPSVVAQPGDTLWSIARRIQPSGDVRALVDRLISLNGGTAVQAGQRVVLPG